MISQISIEDFVENSCNQENAQFWAKSDEHTVIFDYDFKGESISLKMLDGHKNDDGSVEVYGMPIDGLINFLLFVKSCQNKEK